MSELVQTHVAELTTADVAELLRYEAVIKRGLQTFVEVGNALAAIRDGRLYRGTHTTFEEYCRERWGIQRAHAYRLIEGADVVKNLSPVGDILPTAESQVRALTKLEPEQQREVWQSAVKDAGGVTPTAAQVEKAAATFAKPDIKAQRKEIKPLREGHERTTPTLAKPTYVEPKAERICVGFGEFEGRCNNVAGTPWTPVWCERCDELRRAHITKQLEGIADGMGVPVPWRDDVPTAEELDAIAEVEAEREEEEAERLAIEESPLDPMPNSASEPRRAVLEGHKPAPAWMAKYVQRLIEATKHKRRLAIVVAPNAFFDNMPQSHGGADGAMMMLADGSDVIIMPERAVDTEYWRDVIAHEFAHVIHAQVDRMVTGGTVDFNAYESELERFAYLLGGLLAFALLHASFDHKGKRFEV